MLPKVSPSPLTSLKEPIGHPNWIYELKHDGFRGILYVDREQAWLVSRKGKKFRQFDPLLKQVLRSLKENFHAMPMVSIPIPLTQVSARLLSNFYRHPGRAGGSPWVISVAHHPSCGTSSFL